MNQGYRQNNFRGPGRRDQPMTEAGGISRNYNINHREYDLRKANRHPRYPGTLDKTNMGVGDRKLLLMHLPTQPDPMHQKSAWDGYVVDNLDRAGEAGVPVSQIVRQYTYAGHSISTASGDPDTPTGAGFAGTIAGSLTGKHTGPDILNPGDFIYWGVPDESNEPRPWLAGTGGAGFYGEKEKLWPLTFRYNPGMDDVDMRNVMSLMLKDYAGLQKGTADRYLNDAIHNPKDHWLKINDKLQDAADALGDFELATFVQCFSLLNRLGWINETKAQGDLDAARVANFELGPLSAISPGKSDLALKLARGLGLVGGPDSREVVIETREGGGAGPRMTLREATVLSFFQAEPRLAVFTDASKYEEQAHDELRDRVVNALPNLSNAFGAADRYKKDRIFARALNVVHPGGNVDMHIAAPLA